MRCTVEVPFTATFGHSRLYCESVQKLGVQTNMLRFCHCFRARSTNVSSFRFRLFHNKSSEQLLCFTDTNCTVQIGVPKTHFPDVKGTINLIICLSQFGIATGVSTAPHTKNHLDQSHRLTRRSYAVAAASTSPESPKARSTTQTEKV